MNESYVPSQYTNIGPTPLTEDEQRLLLIRSQFEEIGKLKRQLELIHRECDRLRNLDIQSMKDYSNLRSEYEKERRENSILSNRIRDLEECVKNSR